MPAFVHMFAMTPETYYGLDDEDRDALRAYMRAWIKAQGKG